MEKTVVVLRPTPSTPAPATSAPSTQVGFRNKNILPNQHHNQQKEIVNRTYLRHTRGDEPEVVRAKIKNPEYKAPPDVNISQPKYVPQVRPYKGLSGTSAKLENLIAGQNKNPYTLTKLWNLGYLDEVNPNKFYGREYTLHLMNEAGVEPYEETQEETQQPEPEPRVVVVRPSLPAPKPEVKVEEEEKKRGRGRPFGTKKVVREYEFQPVEPETVVEPTNISFNL